MHENAMSVNFDGVVDPWIVADGGRVAVGTNCIKVLQPARAKSISFQEDGIEGDPGFSGLFPGFGGYKLEFLGGDERSWINIKFGKHGNAGDARLLRQTQRHCRC